MGSSGATTRPRTECPLLHPDRASLACPPRRGTHPSAVARSAAGSSEGRSLGRICPSGAGMSEPASPWPCPLVCLVTSRSFPSTPPPHPTTEPVRGVSPAAPQVPRGLLLPLAPWSRSLCSCLVPSLGPLLPLAVLAPWPPPHPRRCRRPRRPAPQYVCPQATQERPGRTPPPACKGRGILLSPFTLCLGRAVPWCLWGRVPGPQKTRRPARPRHGVAAGPLRATPTGSACGRTAARAVQGVRPAGRVPCSAQKQLVSF